MTLQGPCALRILLLVCIMLCVVALSKHDVPMQRSLRQLSIPSASGSLSSSVQQEVRKLNIFGNDGRQHVSDHDTSPYRAVGLLRWNDNVTCTSTLVASNIVVTAAECVLDLNGKLRDTSEDLSSFRLPQRMDIDPASVTRVHKQSDYWTEWTHSTYVLVELDVDLGTTIGALQLATANSFTPDVSLNVQLVDFGDNEKDGECLQRCKIHLPSEFDGPEYMVHHDCDVSGKHSPGAPMLIRSTDLNTYIVGIHTSVIGHDTSKDTSTETPPSYDDTIANHGVLGSFIQPHLSFLLQQTESSSSDALNSVGNTEASTSEVSISSSNSSFTAHRSDSQPTYPRHEKDQTNAGARSAFPPSSTVSSPANTSVGAPHIDIAATVAYSCIGLVCFSWLAIIFAARRTIPTLRCR